MGNRAATKKLSAKERLKARQASNEQEVRLTVKAVLPPPGAPLDVKGALKALHKVGSLALRPNIRKKVLAKLTEELAKTLPQTSITPTDLGAKDFADLADRMVKMLERAGYAEYGIGELRRKRAGLRHNFAGELFEQLVLNHGELQAIFAGLADEGLRTALDVITAEEALRQTLSAADFAKRTRLLTAKGEPALLDLASFVDKNGRALVYIERVVDLRTRVGNSWRMFTDTAYVVRFTPAGGGPQRVMILVETEIKLPAAARDFSGQVAEAQFRHGAADEIEMRGLQSGTRHSFTPDNVIFDVGGISRNAVTITRRRTMTAAFRYVEYAGGGREQYTRIGLAVQVDELRRLIALLFRI
ncbi:hypothetical protein [Catellatospora vulcania]|uniref:hypothetical protein n=1 Tax=Catellatospora vulcania TaxID=1460450 RepID=UPI0012D4C028|nr:hypothetical protein [Catellatospora vulcania]